MSLMSDFEEFAATRDPELRKRLIEENVPLVYHQAAKLGKSLPPEIRLDELNSWGSEGLIDAVERFDPSLGYKFSTYACMRIRGAMLDGLQTREWLPKPLVTKIRALGKAQDKLEEVGLPKSVENIARVMDVTEAEVLTLMRERATKKIESIQGPSLDADGEEDSGVSTWATDDGDHEPNADLSEILLRAGAVVAKLHPSEREVVRCVYEDGMSLKDLAKHLGVAPGNAAATHQRVLAKIRTGLSHFGAPDSSA